MIHEINGTIICIEKIESVSSVTEKIVTYKEDFSPSITEYVFTVNFQSSKSIIFASNTIQEATMKRTQLINEL